MKSTRQSDLCQNELRQNEVRQSDRHQIDRCLSDVIVTTVNVSILKRGFIFYLLIEHDKCPSVRNQSDRRQNNRRQSDSSQSDRRCIVCDRFMAMAQHMLDICILNRLCIEQTL